MPQPFLNVFQADTVCIEYFRFMSGSEDVERKNIPEPEFVPSVTYFTHDTGIMSASVARDFHYLLLMPEPERYFTVSLAAQQPGISQQEAEQILSEFYTRRLRQGRINIPVSRHRAHSHTVRKRAGGYKTPPVGAVPTGGDPFQSMGLPQMILEHLPRQPLLCRKLVIFRFMLWNAYVGGGFHLELVHGFTGFRDVDVGRVTVRHSSASPYLFWGNPF